ncbi:LysR family transcriptional regulator [Achromobacter denitrificans]|uniref:LysR family transcriptional regulator n=1 Tax=Achromobacter denitrificans TaxID=32002 RepID=UPI00240E2CB3|nr:LysR family transcriptional regulator [Achromobacter denitrificans]
MRNPPLPAARLDHVGDLLAFVRVADAQSFTAAAEKLGLSRSAIGKCIARLEQGLGARLLHRSTRSVSLSDEGRVFYEHALRILAEVENAADAMDSRKQAPRGRLRVDLPVSLGRLHVMPLLRDYLREWPGVEADVSFSDDYIDLVRDGVDVAIRIGGETDSRLVRRVLAPHRLITCASPAYLDRHGAPAAPDDLARHQTLAFTHAGALVPLALRGRRTGTPGAGGGTAADGQYGSLARRGAGGRRHRPAGRLPGRRGPAGPAAWWRCWNPSRPPARRYAPSIPTAATWRPRCAS